MIKRLFSGIIAITILAVCFSALAEDYSWLDDLTINQLKALDLEIHKRLPNEFSEGQTKEESISSTTDTYIKITDRSGKEQVLEFGDLRQIADGNAVAFEANFLPKDKFNGAKLEMVGQIAEINGSTNIDGHIVTSYITFGKLGKEQWIIETSGYEELIGKLSVGDYIKVYGNLWSRFGSGFYVYKVNDSVVKLELVP